MRAFYFTLVAKACAVLSPCSSMVNALWGWIYGLVGDLWIISFEVTVTDMGEVPQGTGTWSGKLSQAVQESVGL